MEMILIENPFEDDFNFVGFKITQNGLLISGYSPVINNSYYFEDGADGVEVWAVFYDKKPKPVPFEIQTLCEVCRGSGFIKKHIDVESGESKISDVMANAINETNLTIDKLRIAFNFVGAKIYDPRSDSYVVSDNLALVMADLACRGIIIVSWRLDKALDNPFWNKIEKLADFCDEII